MFLIAEIYGLWSFWYCVHKLKDDIEAAGVNLDEIGKKSSKCETENQDPDSPNADSDGQIEVTTCCQNDGIDEDEKVKCGLNYSAI